MAKATHLLFGLVALLSVAAADARAADPPKCLNPGERRAAIADKRAVPLGRAMRVARNKVAGDLLRARLCDRDNALVYQLTTLGRDGKVTMTTVDAATGQLLGGNR